MITKSFIQSCLWHCDLCHFPFANLWPLTNLATFLVHPLRCSEHQYCAQKVNFNICSMQVHTSQLYFNSNLLQKTWCLNSKSSSREANYQPSWVSTRFVNSAEVRAQPASESINPEHWQSITSSWQTRLLLLSTAQPVAECAGETHIGCAAVLHHPACSCHSYNWFVPSVCCISKVRTDLVTLEPS